MKRVLIIAVLVLFAAMPLMAADFTGSFEYETTFGKRVESADGFGTLDLDIDAEVDEHNTLSLSMTGDVGSDVNIDEVYLITVYGIFTGELGNVSFDSNDYSVTSEGLELQDAGIEVSGVTGAIDWNGFSVKAGSALQPNADYGFTVGYGNDYLSKVEVGYFKNKVITANAQVEVSRFTVGAGMVYDEEVAFGGAAKVDLAPAWIAAGANSDKEFCGDVGVEWDIYGAEVDVLYTDAFSIDEVAAWVAPGGVTYKGGYRFRDKDVFVNISAEF